MGLTIELILSMCLATKVTDLFTNFQEIASIDFIILFIKHSADRRKQTGGGRVKNLKKTDVFYEQPWYYAVNTFYTLSHRK